MPYETRGRSRHADSEDECFMSAERSPASSALHLMEDVIPKFSGRDKSLTITQWIQEIEDNAEVFGWSPTQQLLVARRAVTGTAALWLRSERVFKSWNDLKNALAKEFPDTLDIKTIHEMMCARKKKKDESVLDYMLIMKELGKRGKMPDDVAIKYIIDGIIDYESNKIMLYGVKTYEELKEKLKIYNTVSEKIRKQQITKKDDQTTSTSDVSSRQYKNRCYSCGEKSHMSTDCPHKAEGRKCFKCNEFGHISTECKLAPKKGSISVDLAEKNSKSMIERDHKRQSYYVPNVGRNDAMTTPKTSCHDYKKCVDNKDGDICQQIQKYKDENQLKIIQKKPIKPIRLCGKVAQALIDSGSDVNLMSTRFYESIGSPSYNDEQNITLSGLGQSEVKSIRLILSPIEIDGHSYEDVSFYIVSKDCMPFDTILGQQFLKNIITVMRGGTVWFKPYDDGWMFNINCFSHLDIIGNMSNPALNEEVLQCVNTSNYTPVQTKETPIEMKIILKDDIPVAQRPRRISLKEQTEVEKQVAVWLNNEIIQVSHCASYFRKYIPNFAHIASPLTDLLKKKNNFEFNDEQRLAFNVIKDKLSSNPVSKIFNPKYKIELHTDASCHAYAAILMQKCLEDEGLHPVYYMSKKSTEAEKKFTSYELEALAIIEGVKKYRHYLYGNKMKSKEDLQIYELLLQEERDNYIENRDQIRQKAKLQIQQVQEENIQNYNKKRKESTKYKEGDWVAIKRTQFGSGMKLKPKFLGPYRVTKVKRNDRYDVEKIDTDAEGPIRTSSAADNMKAWPYSYTD